MEKTLKEAQKRYQEKNPVIRIDRDTYNKLIEYSDKTKVPIKNIIKDMTTKYLDSEVEQLKKEDDLLKGKEKKGLKEGLKGLFFK